MAGISSFNIVIQQGDVARDAQNVRHKHLDSNQVAPAQQQEMDKEQATKIHQPDDSEKLKLNKDRSEGRKRKKKKISKEKKNTKGEEPESTGSLLDTIA